MGADHHDRRLRNANAITNGNSDGDFYTNGDSHANIDADSYRYGNRDSNANVYTYSDANCDTYTGGRDLECNRQPHRRTLWIHGDIAV
jgi:hypothetical protein